MFVHYQCNTDDVAVARPALTPPARRPRRRERTRLHPAARCAPSPATIAVSRPAIARSACPGWHHSASCSPVRDGSRGGGMATVVRRSPSAPPEYPHAETISHQRASDWALLVSRVCRGATVMIGLGTRAQSARGAHPVARQVRLAASRTGRRPVRRPSTSLRVTWSCPRGPGEYLIPSMHASCMPCTAPT
jgi:hypothetical protein